MRIILSGEEVLIPKGQYNEEDDLECRGCGNELSIGYSHNVIDCLKILRAKIYELTLELHNLKDNL